MRALLSVADRAGIADLARELIDHGIEVYATDGTRAVLSEDGVEGKAVSDLTQMVEHALGSPAQAKVEATDLIHRPVTAPTWMGAATKLAKGLRELRDDTDSPQYFGLTSSSSTHPIARVEYALRSDDLMSEPQVRQVMEYYLALRMRRLSVRQTGRYAPVRPVAAVRSVPTSGQPNKKH